MQSTRRFLHLLSGLTLQRFRISCPNRTIVLHLQQEVTGLRSIRWLKMVSNGSSITRKKSETHIQTPTTSVQLFHSCNPGNCHIVLLAISLALMSTTVILFQTVDVRHLQSSCASEISNKFSSGDTNITSDSSSATNSTRPIEQTLNTSLAIRGDQQSLGQHVRRYKDIAVRDKAWYLEQLKQNLTHDACHEVPTASAQVFFGLDLVHSNGNLQLQTDRDYEVMIVSYGPDGTRRCSGGDYFEIDVNGTQWKSRPPIKDLGDGTYLFDLRVHGEFPGVYGFRVILMFPNWHGMEISTEEWAMAKDIAYLQIEFVNPKSSSGEMEDLKLCSSKQDYKRTKWEGRWTRKTFNETCTANERGRFLCLDQNQTCEGQWCNGKVGKLESNGWVYSAHCAFRMFTAEEAWNCVAGKWIFFWGDSNHQDTIRNLLHFPLEKFNVGSPDRNGHNKYTNPRNASQTVTITNSFNGHYVSSGNNMGLGSLDHPEHRENVTAYFNGTVRSTPPDVVIMNSGLHDGNNWRDLASFAQAAENASFFWKDLWASVSSEESKRPKMVYRTTVAPGGLNDRLPGRNTKSNVQKHEIFNAVMVDTFLSKFGAQNLQIVDAFDMTFPWHYDHMCSDGPHYGRAPNPKSWIAGGHQYFIDVMLTHVLLNTICPLQ